MPARPSWQIHLYNFAMVLAGDPDVAERAVIETLENSIARRTGHGDVERRVTRQFQAVRQRLLKQVPQGGSKGQSRADAVTLPPGAVLALESRERSRLMACLHELPEPGRSVLTLLSLDALEGDEIARLLDLRREELGDIAHEARTSLYQKLQQ